MKKNCSLFIIRCARNGFKKIITAALFLLLIASTQSVWSQVSLTGPTYSENFDSYSGTSSTGPTGWSVSCGRYKGKGTGTSNAGGAWSYGSGSDYSIGYLGSGSAKTFTATVSFVNNTGDTITSLIISYNFEQWRVGGGNTAGFAVSGTGSLSSVSGVSGLSQSSSNSGSTGTCQTTAKSVTLTGLSIAPSASFGLQFYSYDGSSYDNGKSIDDFTLCIPPDINSQNTSAQTICTGNAFTPLSVVAGGSGLTYQWYSNTTASNSNGTDLGSSYGAQTDSLTPPSSTTGTTYYYAEVSNGSCAAVSAISGAIEVVAPPAISSQSTATQTACMGATLNPLSVSATGTGLTYQWYSNTTAANTGGTSLGSANGAQTDTYTPQSSTAGTTYYYCEVDNGACAVTSAISDAIIVNPSPVIVSQSTATQTVCINTPFTPISVTATGTGLTYQWYSNTSASTTGGTSLGTANGAQTDTYTPQSTSAGTTYYYAILDNGTCQTTSAVSGAINVNDAPAVTSQSTATQTVCINTAFTPISVTATGGGLSYQWYSNTTAANTGGTSLGSANGAQTDTYTPQSTSAGTLYYYVEVTGTCAPMTVSAVSGDMIVNPAPAITSQTTATQTVCVNTAFTPISVTATGTGLTYQWYSNTTASTTGGTSLGTANGAQTDTYTPQSASAGTLYYYVEVAGTCAPMTVSAVSGDMIVNPAPAITSQTTATQTVCKNVAFNPISITATGLGLTYQWYSNTTATNTGGTSLGTANGAQTDTYTPQSNTAGTLYYYAEVSGTCAPMAVSAVSDAMVVNDAPAIASQSTATQTVCEGTAFNPISVKATGTGLTYQWYSNTTASTTGGTSLGSANGAQTDTYTPQSNTAGTFYYYAEVSGTCSPMAVSAISGDMVVKGVPTITTQSTAAQTVCKGDVLNPISVTATGDGLTYQWYINLNPSNTGGTSLGTANGAQTDTYTPQNTSSGTFYYYVEVSGSCSPTAVSTVSDPMIVNGTPTISSQSTAAQTICMGAAFTPVSVSAVGTGLTYQWFSNTTPSNTGGTNLGAANGAQTDTYTPPATTVGTMYYYVEVSGVCSPMAVSAVSGDMTVNELPAITGQLTAAQTVCPGAAFAPISVTATGTNLTYQWFSNTTATTTGGTSLGTANGAQTDTYTPQSTSAGTLYYYVEVSGACSPMAVSAVSGDMVVNEAPAITHQSTAAQTVCKGTTFAPITVTATGTNITYQWFSNTTAATTGGTSLGTANDAQTDTYTPQNTTAGTLYYYVEVSGACSPKAVSAISGDMIVNEAPAITTQPATAPQTVVKGAPVTPLTVTATGTNVTYQWFSNTVASNTGGIAISGATTATYTPQNSTMGTLYYYVEISGICNPAVTSNVSGAITIKSPITVTISNNNLTQITTKELNRNEVNTPISRFQITVTGGTAQLSSLSFVTPGSATSCNYLSTDLYTFKVFYTTSPSFNAFTPVTGAIAQPSAKSNATMSETITFNGITHIFAPGTYYIWVTANILPGAVLGRTITVNAPTITINEGSVNGSTVATGTQTVASGLGIEDATAAGNIFVGSYANEVKISAGTGQNLTAEITDMLGRVLTTTTIAGDNKMNTIAMQGVATGYYIVKVYGNNTLHTAKVYIQQ